MLIKYYPIESVQKLRAYLNVYVPMLINTAEVLSINLSNTIFAGDHIGLQVLSKTEFDEAHAVLLKYSSMVKDSVIHNRRNRVYRFNEPLRLLNGLVFIGIETFEPKPDADLRKLKPGVEHATFKVANYDDFLAECKEAGVPVDKSEDISGSKFFKTSLVNLVEIEFRSDFLVS